MDFSTLVPGDIIAQEQCELMFGFSQKQDYAKYALALLALKAQIEKELKDAGHLYTVTTQKSRINVLTHRQASEYNRRRFKSTKKSMRKSHKLLAVVDTSHLSAEEREEHERQLLRQGRELQALDKVRKQYKATPHVSDIPRMVAAVN